MNQTSLPLLSADKEKESYHHTDSLSLSFCFPKALVMAQCKKRVETGSYEKSKK